LERISELEERYMEYYLYIIEKYLIVEGGTTNTSLMSNNLFSNDTSILNTRNPNKRSAFLTRHSDGKENDISRFMVQLDVLNKKIDLLEKEKDGYVKTINEYSEKIVGLQSDNNSLQKEITMLKEKLETNKVELGILKTNNAKFLEVNEDFIKETLALNNLKNIIFQKDMEIEEIKKESDKMLKTYTDQITLLNDKITEFEDKQNYIHQLKSEMDKLKLKNKELTTTNEKYADYDELRSSIDKSKGIIDNMVKEKNGLLSQIDNLNAEVLSCKEKIIQLEFDKKKYDYNTQELQKHINKLENTKPADNSEGSSKRPSNMGSNPKVLVDLEREMSLDFTKLKDHSQIEILEREFYEIRREKEELEEEVRNQNIRIGLFNEEKKRLVEQIDDLKHNNIAVNNEMEKIVIEKDRIKIEKEKLDLELTKSSFDLVKEKRLLEEQLSSLRIKFEEVNVNKNNVIRDLEAMRDQYNNTNNFCDKLLNEKKSLINDMQVLKDEIINIKETYNKQSNNL
jgi:chromosome segregation ATPase